jgi:hypothetical protein
MKLKSVVITLLTSLVLGLFADSAIAKEEIFAWEPCSISDAAPCIESLAYVNENGIRIQGKLSGRTKSLNRDISLKNYPFVDYEWSLPGIKQTNGTDKVLITAYYFPKNLAYCWLPDQDPKTCDYGIDQLNFDITPSWWDSQPPATHFPNSDRDNLCGTKENPSVCISGWSMNGDVTYEIIAKMPKGFDARMLIGEGASGELKFSVNGKGEKLFTLLAKPASRSFVWNLSQRPIYFKDSESADVTINSLNFYIHSSSSSEPQWFSRCDKGEGLSVWHNSLGRSSPYWISSEQSLAMDVSGIHKRADGSQNVGTFQIQIPVSVAQCMWGVDLSKAVVATISALYGEGKASEIVTVSSKIANGFYYLNANGFHYSSPTLKVKLTQEPGKDLDKVISEPNQPPQVSTAAKSKVIATKKTITCVKGKTSKKLTGLNPKCPAGYKKK